VVGSGLIIIGAGRIRVISTSKIKKITVIIKNRRENGSRDGNAASNPHSNDDGFSREFENNCLAMKLTKIRRPGIKVARVILNKIKASLRDFLIGS